MLSVGKRNICFVRNTCLTSGVGHFSIDATERRTLDFQSITIPLPSPLPPMVIPARRILQEENADIQHTNLYLYSYIKLVPNVTFTVGASGDITSGDSPSFKNHSQFNPKFGVTWNPFASTTVRGAVFRTLKKTLITDQTLEPSRSPALISSLMILTEQKRGAMGRLSIRNSHRISSEAWNSPSGM